MTARPFFDTAREIRRGQFLEDCADELQRHDRALADASQAIIERIRKESGGAVFFGRPE